MDTRWTRARFLGVALITALLAALSSPGALVAQEAPELTDEKLGQYATLYLAITEARDEFQASKARVHDREARERLREEMDERLAGLYEEHGMPKTEYDGITFLVSVDADARERFEAILAERNANDDRETR